MVQLPHDDLGGKVADAGIGAMSLKDQVVLARAGDGQAFRELFRSFQEPICRYLTRMVGNDEVGRDLAQETFLLAWKKLSSLQDALLFKSWLYRIATNIALSHLRHVRLVSWLPWREHEKAASQSDLRSSGPEEQFDETEIVEQTLARISPRYRTCLLLQLVAGFSQHEIAAMLDISEQGVRSNVCRGREQFRRLYQQLKGEV
jgi:RNA polymerase sigma-70 factor, ECF subfamily